MADDLDTEKAPAQGTDQNLGDGQDKTPPVDQDKGKKDKPFTPEQEQYIGSWMGRIIKKQFEESIVPLVDERLPRKPHVSTSDHNDVIKRFNEELSEEIFTNPLGAIQKAVKALEESKTQLSQAQTVQVDKAITSYSEDPLYKDIYQDMKTIAHDAVKGGYPPNAAAKYALAEAKAKFYESKAAPDGEGGLNLSEGGRSTRPSKAPKLPPEFKKAYERDKAKGYFKNEAEFIANLSPSIRQKYGF